MRTRCYVPTAVAKSTQAIKLTALAVVEDFTFAITLDENTVNTGDIYDTYQDLCSSTEEEPLSSRRISDNLKQLELLNLIQSEYHYGGRQGKTQIIKFRGLSS